MQKSVYSPYTDTFCYGKVVNYNEIILTNYCDDCKFVFHSPYGMQLNIINCANCSSKLLESNSILFKDDRYCEICWKSKFFNCYRCSKASLRETGKTLNGIFYCEKCFKKYGIVCSYCNQIGLNSGRKTKEYKDVCICCSQTYFEYCDNCGLFDLKENIISHFGYHCKECYNKIFIKCSHCSKDFKKKLKDYNSDNDVSTWLCSSCLNKSFKCFSCGKRCFIKSVYYNGKEKVYVCADCKSQINSIKCRECSSLLLNTTDDICYICSNLHNESIISAKWQQYNFHKIITPNNYYIITDGNIV